MSIRRRSRGNRPPYPSYPLTRFEGCLPAPPFNVSAHAWPSGENPYYRQYPGTRGRQLAGTSDMNIDMHNAEPQRDYKNEVDLLATGDDVNGNGIFDAFDTPPNTNPNAGVFQDNWSMPGYLMREQFYVPGEVVNLPGNGATMYVPGGAVAIDEAQRQAIEIVARLDDVNARPWAWRRPLCSRRESHAHIRLAHDAAVFGASEVGFHNARLCEGNGVRDGGRKVAIGAHRAARGAARADYAVCVIIDANLHVALERVGLAAHGQRAGRIGIPRRRVENDGRVIARNGQYLADVNQVNVVDVVDRRQLRERYAVLSGDAVQRVAWLDDVLDRRPIGQSRADEQSGHQDDCGE